jgi:Na+/H+ antiporter NhaD/arsenite permease-like protein
VLLLFCVVAILTFRRELQVSNERKARIMDFDESRSLTNIPLMIKSLVVIALVVVGFLLHGALHVEASIVAMGGAALLLLLTGSHDLEDFYKDVEWGTIFFFIGLFILVGGVVEEGWIQRCADFIIDVTAGNIMLTAIVLVWVSGILSAVIDNIPYVATMIPMVQAISTTVGPDKAAPLWWALALGACLGGNGTLIGASANVVSASIAGKNGYPITFAQFTKHGAFITVLALLVCTGYIVVRYF